MAPRSDLRERLVNEIEQYGYYGSTDRRKTAEGLADVVMDLLEEETHWGPMSVPEYHEDGSPAMTSEGEGGFIFATPVHKHHFEWGNRRRWVSPWEKVGEWETSEQLDVRLQAEGPASS